MSDEKNILDRVRGFFAYKINGRPYYEVIAEWQRDAAREFEAAYRQDGIARFKFKDEEAGE